MSESNEIPGAKWRVWWIPQVPMKAFKFGVASLEEGRRMCDCLAEYDKFQFENRIKPDYSNVGGIEFCHPNFDEGEWTDVPEDDEEWGWIKAEIADPALSQPKE